VQKYVFGDVGEENEENVCSQCGRQQISVRNAIPCSAVVDVLPLLCSHPPNMAAVRNEQVRHQKQGSYDAPVTWTVNDWRLPTRMLGLSAR
jgi:putative heme degradation protein